jgi:hypothetical protein
LTGTLTRSITMGREAKAVKDRRCEYCDRTIYTDAQTMMEHDKYCREKLNQQMRLEKIGLVSP